MHHTLGHPTSLEDLTSRATWRYPYSKSCPSENRFGAVWLKVRATLRRDTYFGQNGALAAAWCAVWTQGWPRLPGGTATIGFA